LGDRQPTLAVKDRVLMEQLVAEARFSAVYERDDAGRVVLRTIEAPP
jgi:hypothetical protein